MQHIRVYNIWDDEKHTSKNQKHHLKRSLQIRQLLLVYNLCFFHYTSQFRCMCIQGVEEIQCNLRYQTSGLHSSRMRLQWLHETVNQIGNVPHHLVYAWQKLTSRCFTAYAINFSSWSLRPLWSPFSNTSASWANRLKCCHKAKSVEILGKWQNLLNISMSYLFNGWRMFTYFWIQFCKCQLRVSFKFSC